MPATALHGIAPLPLPGLPDRVLVQASTLLKPARVIVDGVPRRPSRRIVEVTDGEGHVRKIRLRWSFLDPCPRVEVDGAAVDVFPRLPTWVTILCNVPFVLVITGGAVGGLFGALAAHVNFRVARSALPAAARFLAGAGATALAAAAVVTIAAVVQAFLGR